MASLRIEHVNLTVSDPERTAALLERIFGWRVRWSGPARNNGRTIHVGTDEHYVAVYSGPAEQQQQRERFEKGLPLNHVGIEVEDLDATEQRVIAAGLQPYGHDDYEPGRRFYFFDPDGIEFEVVSYANGACLA